MNYPTVDVLTTPTSHKALKILVIVALVLLIASILLLWLGSPSFSDRDVVLKLDGPTQARSGDEVTYTLSYENNTKLTLRNMNFRFFYPEDAVVVKDDKAVQNQTSEGFTVDSLAPGQKGEMKFTAFLVGDSGNIKDARVSLIFNADRIHSSFQKEATVSTTIVGLPIPLTLVAPPSTVSGQEVTYMLDYRNESGADISNLDLSFTFPDGFTFERATPSPGSQSGNTADWSVKTLRNGGGSRITIVGTLSGNERDSKTISVVLRRTVNGEYVDYEKASASTVISSPLLDLSMAINGDTGYVTHLDDRLHYVVNYKNTSNQTLIGLTLAVKLEGDMFDFSTVDAGSGFFDSNSNTVVWNAGALPNLGALSPGQSGQADFIVRIRKGFISGLSGTRNFFVQASATLSTPNVPSGIDASEISAQTALVTKISTQPVLTQKVYYNDPSFGSTGPFPPTVGTETAFTVHWQIMNPGNATTGVSVVGTLPTGVSWKNVSSVGAGQPQPVFDPNTSQVKWNIGTLPQGVGVSSEPYELIFQVSITPSTAQKGSPVTLVKGVQLSGKDSFTSQDIVISASDATTNTIVDRSDSGTVQ